MSELSEGFVGPLIPFGTPNDGDVPVWDQGTIRWVPGAGGGGGDTAVALSAMITSETICVECPVAFVGSGFKVLSVFSSVGELGGGVAVAFDAMGAPVILTVDDEEELVLLFGTPGDPVDPRIDVIYLTVTDWSTGAWTLGVSEGIPDSDPEPIFPDGLGIAALATITVPPLATSWDDCIILEDVRLVLVPDGFGANAFYDSIDELDLYISQGVGTLDLDGELRATGLRDATGSGVYDLSGVVHLGSGTIGDAAPILIDSAFIGVGVSMGAVSGAPIGNAYGIIGGTPWVGFITPASSLSFGLMDTNGTIVVTPLEEGDVIIFAVKVSFSAVL